LIVSFPLTSFNFIWTNLHTSLTNMETSSLRHVTNELSGQCISDVLLSLPE
jgi:hypothetical protein